MIAELAQTVAVTAGLILAGASGAQLIKSPEAWPRTVPAFGQRVADQTGLYLVLTGTSYAFAKHSAWQADTTTCPRSALVRCGVTRTLTAFDGHGVRRANVPLFTSIAAGTAVSALWRPERKSADTLAGFVAFRLAITTTGYVAERILEDWWRTRRR